jgi:hypothetical protein
VLPGVIVGGLLVGGLALGMGTASAASCTSGGKSYDISASADVVSVGGACAPKVGSLSALADLLSALPPVTVPDPTKDTATPAGTTTSGSTTTGSTTTGAATSGTTTSDGAPKAGGTSNPPKRPRTSGRTSTQNGSAGTLPPAAIPAAPAVLPPAPVAGLPLAPGLGAPALTAGFAPSALAGGSLPGGLSSGLFGAGFGNPALLAGTPFGAAAASLYQPQADSAVTTVSHSEVLAAGAPRGIGTATAIAAVALACVVAILVRSRILRRITERELVGGSPLAGTVAADSGAVDAVPADDLVTADEPLLAA